MRNNKPCSVTWNRVATLMVGTWIAKWMHINNRFVTRAFLPKTYIIWVLDVMTRMAQGGKNFFE